MTPNRSVVLYIAMSLDGYIAAQNDDLSFLATVEQTGEDYGYVAFQETVDTVIMGRKTFDWVWDALGHVPHPHLETYVITGTPREAIGRTQFYTDNLIDLVQRLKQQTGKRIYCDGGAQVAQALWAEHLINEMIISVVPVFLGEGTRLFQGGYSPQNWKTVSVRSFSSGLVQIHYKHSLFAMND